MNNPEYVKIGDKKYKINSDFRVAIECQKIATDVSISDEERALAIIYKLFGEEGLNDENNYNKLIELAQKFLACGQDMSKCSNEEQQEPDIDYEQDKYLIRSSFIQDYNYNPYEMKYLHWWDFWNDLNNLSDSELGTCCKLNEARRYRNMDLSEIKDAKERERYRKLKEFYAIKKEEKEYYHTKEEKNSINEFLKSIGKE